MRRSWLRSYGKRARRIDVNRMWWRRPLWADRGPSSVRRPKRK